jgi:hypothetical protein
VQTATFGFWGVQLEIAQPGQTQPTPLEKVDPGLDLRNCQRFYQTSQFSSYGAAVNGATLNVMVPLVATMRAAPTVAPNFSATPGITSPTMAALGASMLLLSGTLNSTSYGAAGIFQASADL